jgi:pilus assembly protein CpaE
MPAQAVLTEADIIVAEVDPSHEGSIRRIDEIASLVPDVPIIAGVERLDIRTTRVLLKRGVTDLLEVPFSIEELLEVLVDVDPAQRRAERTPVHRAPIVSFFGCSGGVGTTTIATHFAAIAHESGWKSSMIDLDIQHGDVSDYLGLARRLSLQDIFEADKRLDAELLSSVMCGRDGLPSVLAAPDDILPIEEVQFEKLQPIFATLRANTDLVSIDLPTALTNWGLSTLYASDRIVLVGTLAVTMLRKMRRQIDFFLSMGIERENIKVVLNRAHTGLFKTIKTSEAEEALRQPVSAVLPDDAAILGPAQDQGILAWEHAGAGKFEKAIRPFAHDLLDELKGEV